MGIPEPIFKKDLNKISWEKIYNREYGVQYSEVAVSVLTYKDHFPNISTTHIVIPGEGQNTAFYIDKNSWTGLVDGLNKKYTNNVKGLEKYEKQFLYDGKNYLNIAKKIAKKNLKKLSNQKLMKLFLTHQEMRNRYSVFAWSAYILNNYVADRAVAILEPYIKKQRQEGQKQEIIDALFKPEKLAAVIKLQKAVEKRDGKLTTNQFDNLYEKFKWLSCLDIQNKPWTKNEFRAHIKHFTKPNKKKGLSFEKTLKELKPNKKDLEYLHMAKRFVYIKDARDDFRRESVYLSGALWKELGKRMGIDAEDMSYLQDNEIISFLKNRGSISKDELNKRKTGFVMYLSSDKKLACLSGSQITEALGIFKLNSFSPELEEIIGRVASKGAARGKVAIVRGVKDLDKVKKGDILVAVTTHPDFVSAMRRCSAIVTDEGGITSHAAIVSREFGIPCIVGTKHATKILNDGDLVEVDANTGIVRKLA